MPQETCCQKLVSFVVIYIAIPLCMPLIFLLAPFFRLYDAWLYEWAQSRNISNPTLHRQKVSRVQQQVKEWNATGRKTRMVTGKSSWNSFSMPGFSKREFAQIQIDDLSTVVQVDTSRRVVVVEPGMMMGQLTSILIPMGWTIPVVPEFESLTVGGLICGTGVESTSTRYGLFAETPIEYEIVTSNGAVVTCSKDENSDLFHSLPWSHGTLGFLMSATIPLLPVKKYVQLEYHITKSDEEAQRLLESQDHEFVEGLAYGRNKFVVTLGNFSDRPDSKRGPVNHINRWYKPFFYKHVESFLTRSPRKDGQVHVEYYPLRDYYHRHTRAYFWTLLPVFPYVNNALFRLFFGYIFPGNSKLGFRLLYALGMEKLVADGLSMNGVCQDFLIPLKHLRPAMDFFHDLMEIYPVWLCPAKFFNKPGMTHCSGEAESELYFDIGVYGIVHDRKKAEHDLVASSQKMESFTIDHQGVQLLYAPSYLSREDFRRMFDMTHYEQVRTKYECLDAFPDVYDKVSKHARGLSQA